MDSHNNTNTHTLVAQYKGGKAPLKRSFINSQLKACKHVNTVLTSCSPWIGVNGHMFVMSQMKDSGDKKEDTCDLYIVEGSGCSSLDGYSTRNAHWVGERNPGSGL